MSLIFDALRELETQPARAEPFAIAAAKRRVPAAPLRRLRWRVAALALLLVAGAATAVTLYARRAHETAPTPMAPATLAATLPASAPAPVVPPAVPSAQTPVPADATAEFVAAAISPVAASHQPNPSAHEPVAAAIPPAAAPTAPRSAATLAAVGSPAGVPAQAGLLVPPRAPPALPAAEEAASIAAASAAPSRVVPDGAMGIARSPTIERTPAAAVASAPAVASPPAPGPGRAAEPAATGMTRPMIENPGERQRIVVSSAHAASAAAPADELALQRRVATFTDAMQRKDFDAARRDLHALSAQLSPDSLTLLRLRAWHALATADGAHARDLYEQILNRVADDENAAINLSVLDARDGRVERARERLRRLLARNPGSTQIASVLHSMDERGP